ncbi:MAG: hypothetical protein ABSB59_10450 [Streptosporangiaceae bacterium]|jgi:hypothetical protein
MNNMYRPDADGGYPADAAEPGSARPPKRRLRWGAGIILAGFLVGGGITLAVVSAGGTATASPASSTQGAQLNTVLADAAGSPGVSAARVRWALGRLRRLGGVEGTATFHNKKGFRTLSFERGSIQSVSSADVVIKSPDGTTWTWKIVSDTVVRKNGAKTTTGALSAGQTVFAGGPVVSGTRDARLIVIRPAGSSSSGTAGSQSTQTSLSLHSNYAAQ